MKTFVAIVAVCVSAIFVVEAALSEEQRAKLETARKDCATSTNVSPELVKKLRAGEFHDDPVLKQYLSCVAKKIGFVDDSGTIQKAVISQKIGNALDDSAAAAKITDECSIQKANIEDTVYDTIKCFIHKSPKITEVI